MTIARRTLVDHDPAEDPFQNLAGLLDLTRFFDAIASVFGLGHGAPAASEAPRTSVSTPEPGVSDSVGILGALGRQR